MTGIITASGVVKTFRQPKRFPGLGGAIWRPQDEDPCLLRLHLDGEAGRGWSHNRQTSPHASKLRVDNSKFSRYISRHDPFRRHFLVLV